MRRFFTDSQRDMIVKEDGCCRHCGFIEKDLYAIEADDGSFQAVCEECVAQEHLDPFGGTNFKLAYLPELSVRALSHFCRVTAMNSFATLQEKQFPSQTISEGLLPEACSYREWWTGDFKHDSLNDLRTSVRASIPQLKMARRVMDAYAFLKGRMDFADKLHPSLSPRQVKEQIGAEEFSRSYRLLPLSISSERIRSWGTFASSFKNHPTRGQSQAEHGVFDLSDEAE